MKINLPVREGRGMGRCAVTHPPASMRATGEGPRCNVGERAVRVADRWLTLFVDGPSRNDSF